MASLSLRHLSKTYDNGVNAIKDVTLEVDDKEFMVLAGPVGCGISTVLRMIAGVEDITDGELLVDGERMNETPSIDRDMAMIFKNGKLYPQMNIYDNLAFGLKLKELPIGEIDARIAEVTQVLNIGHLLDKKMCIRDRYTFRASRSLLTSPPYPSQSLLDSFLLEPKHRKKKYCHIQMCIRDRYGRVSNVRKVCMGIHAC